MDNKDCKELALILRDRFREIEKLKEFYNNAVSYLFKVFEEKFNEIRSELINFGGDPKQLKMYKSPDGDFIVLKIGTAMTTVFAYPEIGTCPVEVAGTSGLCGRVIVFDGDFRQLEIDNLDQLATIEEDSLFIFMESKLFHIVPPTGLFRTDVPRFVQLVLTVLVQKGGNTHYSPLLEQIVGPTQ